MIHKKSYYTQPNSISELSQQIASFMRMLLMQIPGLADFSYTVFSETDFPTPNLPTNKFSETTFSDNKFPERHILPRSKL